MPLFTVTMRSGRRDPDKAAISVAIHAASVAAGYPENDRFQRFLSLDAGDLIVDPTYPALPRPRSDALMMIEVVVSSGTAATQKRALLAALIARLEAIGVDGNDVIVLFGEVDRANSSFGNGTLAPPVATEP